MDQELPVTSLRKQDYLNWKQDPVTRLVLSAIHDRIKELLLELGNGSCLGNETLYAQTVGYVQGLKALYNIEYEDIEEEDSENA